MSAGFNSPDQRWNQRHADIEATLKKGDFFRFDGLNNVDAQMDFADCLLRADFQASISAMAELRENERLGLKRHGCPTAHQASHLKS